MAAGKTLAINDDGLPGEINNMAGWGVIGSRPATGDVLAGSFYYDTTNSILYQEQNGTWVAVLQIKTLNAANETVEAGYYAATTLSGVDADLAVENIKKDIVIFGFTGTAKRLEDYATNATLGMFQTYTAIGDIIIPANINDNDTGTLTSANGVSQYAEVVFGDLVMIKRWRQFGHTDNNGDGTWKIQYWNVDTDAWVNWITGIATRTAGNWSSLSTESEVITTKIRLVCTAVDTQGVSKIMELEVIF